MGVGRLLVCAMALATALAGRPAAADDILTSDGWSVAADPAGVGVDLQDGVAPGGGLQSLGDAARRPARLDGRVRITDTLDFPNKAIVQIVRRDPGGPYKCTGFLISRDTVATAGHCVHPGGGGADRFFRTTGITVYPGRNGAEMPFGACRVKMLYAPGAWVHRQDLAADVGALRLDCQRPFSLGFERSVDALEGRTVTLRGYPCDKPKGTLWSMDGAITASTAGKVYYRLTTYGCQSGSPVFEMRPDGPYVLAIHTNGADSTSGGANYGTRIGPAVFDFLARVRRMPAGGPDDAVRWPQFAMPVEIGPKTAYQVARVSKPLVPSSGASVAATVETRAAGGPR